MYYHLQSPRLNGNKCTISHSPESSTISLHPAVNVEDVDNEKAGTGEGEGREENNDIPQIPSIQDPKLTTLTVPVTPSGGRQR